MIESLGAMSALILMTILSGQFICLFYWDILVFSLSRLDYTDNSTSTDFLHLYCLVCIVWVKDATWRLSHVAKWGARRLRGSTGGSSEDGYRFGDIKVQRHRERRRHSRTIFVRIISLSYLAFLSNVLETQRGTFFLSFQRYFSNLSLWRLWPSKNCHRLRA